MWSWRANCARCGKAGVKKHGDADGTLWEEQKVSGPFSRVPAERAAQAGDEATA